MKRVATTMMLCLALLGAATPTAMAQPQGSTSKHQKIELATKLWSVYNARGDAGLTQKIEQLDESQRKKLIGEIVLLQRATDKLYSGKVNPFANFIYKTRTMMGLPAVDPSLNEQPEAPQEPLTADTTDRSAGNGGKMTATSSAGGSGGGSHSSLGGSSGGGGGGGGGSGGGGAASGGGSGSSGGSGGSGDKADSGNKSAGNKTAPANTAQVLSPNANNTPTTPTAPETPTSPESSANDPAMNDAPTTPTTPESSKDSDTASVPDVSPTIDPVAPPPPPVTGTNPGAALPSTDTHGIGPGFKVFDALLYQGKPDLSADGINSIKLIYGSAIWPRGASTDILPPEAHVRALARTMPADQIVVLDIEHWDLTDQHVDWLIQILTWFREEKPGIKIGYYSLLPERNYVAAVLGENHDKYKAWHERNQSAPALRLAFHVDCIFPSLYTFYEDQAGWVTYARANIAEARIYGKPVYAFIWPQYHTSGAKPAELRGTPISAAFWQKQMLTAGTNADGVVLWGGYRTPWDPNAGWWRVTKLLMHTPLAEIIGD